MTKMEIALISIILIISAFMAIILKEVWCYIGGLMLSGIVIWVTDVDEDDDKRQGP